MPSKVCDLSFCSRIKVYPEVMDRCFEFRHYSYNSPSLTERILPTHNPNKLSEKVHPRLLARLQKHKSKYEILMRCQVWMLNLKFELTPSRNQPITSPAYKSLSIKKYFWGLLQRDLWRQIEIHCDPSCLNL